MNKNVRQILFPLLAAAIWGTAFVVQGNVADKIPPFFFNGSRMLVAAVALLLIILVREGGKKKKLKAEYEKPNVKASGLSGLVCGVALFFAVNLQQFGITLGVSGGISAFITALYMILVPIIGVFLGKKTSLSVWIAVVIALPAMYLVCGVKGFSFDLGSLLTLLCSLCFALHIILVDAFAQNADGFILSCAQFLSCGVISLVCSFIFERVDYSLVLGALWQILYVGIFSSAIGYTLQIEAQRGTNPTCVSLLLCLESVFALLCEIIVGLITGDVVAYGVLRYVGCGLMLVAVFLSQIDLSFLKGKNGRKKIE